MPIQLAISSLIMELQRTSEEHLPVEVNKVKTNVLHIFNKYWSITQEKTNPRLNSIFVTHTVYIIFLAASFIQYFWKISYPDQLYDIANCREIVASLLKRQQPVLRKMVRYALLAEHRNNKLNWICTQDTTYTGSAAVVLPLWSDTTFRVSRYWLKS